MSGEESSPKREGTPLITPPISSIPQKRALEDDHQPPVSSPLNPDSKPAKSQDDAPFARERASREKKESLKKRESKVGTPTNKTNARATPDPRASSQHKSKKVEEDDNTLVPIRYKLPPPKITDFDAPRGPVFTPLLTKVGPDGMEIQYNETSDQ